MPGDMIRRSVRLIWILFLFLIFRTPVFSVSITNWKLVRYPDALPVCVFRSGTSTPPGFSDIRSSCGDPLGIEFALTPACGDPTRLTCVGLFLLNHDTNEAYGAADYDISGTVLSGSEIETDILNCEPNALCQEQPIITFTDRGLNRLERQFTVTIDSAVYPCKESCSLEINTASEKSGSWLTVQTETPAGHRVELRVFFRLKRLNTSPPLYFFDWNASDLHGSIPYGAETWGLSPTGIEAALLDGSILDPNVPIDDLWSDYQLHGLCAELIYRGTIRATECPGFGLENITAVNACGLAACRDTSIQQQNRMNMAILHAAERFRIPPKILKNLFLAETQFTRYRGQEGEVGFGHLTGLSIDTLLRWSNTAFSNACATIFPQLPQQCEAGYDGMEDPYRELLKGVIFRETADDEGVTLSAQILNACKNQVKWLLQSLTDRPLDQITDYDTLWKLTVAAYHAGGECTNQAIDRTLRMNGALDWTHLRAAYTGKCRSGALYVDRVFDPDYASYDDPE